MDVELVNDGPVTLIVESRESRVVGRSSNGIGVGGCGHETWRVEPRSPRRKP